MITTDVIITREDGWVKIPIVGASMMLVAKTENGMLLRYGSGSTSTGMPIQYNVIVVVDEDVWVRDVFADGNTVVAVTQ